MLHSLIPTAVTFSVVGPDELSLTITGVLPSDVGEWLGTVSCCTKLPEPVLSVIASDEDVTSVTDLHDRVIICHTASAHSGLLYGRIMRAFWDHGFKPTFTYA